MTTNNKDLNSRIEEFLYGTRTATKYRRVLLSENVVMSSCDSDDIDTVKEIYEYLLAIPYEDKQKRLEAFEFLRKEYILIPEYDPSYPLLAFGNTTDNWKNEEFCRGIIPKGKDKITNEDGYKCFCAMAGSREGTPNIMVLHHSATAAFKCALESINKPNFIIIYQKPNTPKV
jgi:hypothetical protein